MVKTIELNEEKWLVTECAVIRVNDIGKVYRKEPEPLTIT